MGIWLCLQAAEEETDPRLPFPGSDFPVAVYPLEVGIIQMVVLNAIDCALAF